jgi:hypothetical protein
VGNRADADCSGRNVRRTEKDGQSHAVDIWLVFAVVSAESLFANSAEGLVKLGDGCRGASCRSFQNAITDPRSNGGVVGQAIGEEHFSDTRRMSGVAAANHGGEPHRSHCRIDFGSVDDAGAIEDRVVRRLSVATGELIEDRLNPRSVRPGIMVAEGHPQELVAENVVSRTILVGQPCATQRRECAMHCGLGALDESSHFVERDAVWMPREFGEHREHAV